MEWGISECGQSQHLCIFCQTMQGKYRIESLAAATIPGALKVIKDAFFPDETVCIGTEVNKNPAAGEELLELCADAALDGVSLVAVEISTGDVVAASFNKLQVAATNEDEKTFFDEFVEERCKQPSSKALINFMSDVDSRCNFFESFREWSYNNQYKVKGWVDIPHSTGCQRTVILMPELRYKVDCSLEIMFLATLREHRLKKLGYLLCKFSLDVGKRLKTGPVSHIALKDLGPKYSYMNPREVTTKIPKICQAIGTSIATQKIGAALNFTVHLRVSFAEYEYDGKNYVERNGFDPFCEGIAQSLE